MSNAAAPRWIGWPLALLVLSLLVARFAALDKAPPGFYLDEAAIATQVICVAQTHADSSGRSWPLYSPALAGGQVSAPLLYPAALWTQAFGSSPSSLRAFAGMQGLLLALAIATAVWLTSGRRLAGGLSLLICLSSPWLFGLSRVFWDPIVGASWFAVALSAYWIARDAARPARQRALLWCLAGIAAAIAAYAYPPVRIQLLVSGLAMALLDHRWRRDPLSLLGLAWLLLLIVPLAMLYSSEPGFAERGNMLAIWNADWLDSQGLGLEAVPQILLNNLLAHFGPGYLFLSGDINLRHTTGYGGIIGPSEGLALLLIAAFARRFVFSREGLLLIAFYLAALLPAAMTRDYIPHGLRSLGGVGPLLLFMGMGVAHVLRERPAMHQQLVATVLLGTSAIWAAFFLHDYFTEYPLRSRVYFVDDGVPDKLPEWMALATNYYQSQLGAPLHCPGPQPQ